MTIGERIRNIRKSQKLTQKQLGELAGIAEPTIRRYELGKLNPKFVTLAKIAEALKVNPADIDDRLVVNLGSDVMYETTEGDHLMIPSDDPLSRASTILQNMNDEGTEEWLKRGDEMLQIPQYRRNNDRQGGNGTD